METRNSSMIDRIEIKPDSRWATIYVAGQRVSKVAAMMIPRIPLHIGQEWTRDTESRIEHANEVAKTCGRMVRMLSTSQKSTKELESRLTKSGVNPDVVKEALDLLGQIGMVSDKRLAEQVIETQKRKGRSQAAVQRELSRRGLSAPVEALEQEDLLAAIAVAREAAARVPPEADVTTRWRRVLGALGRRGFDEEIAVEASRVILGDAPEPTVD